MPSALVLSARLLVHCVHTRVPFRDAVHAEHDNVVQGAVGHVLAPSNTQLESAAVQERSAAQSLLPSTQEFVS